MGLFDQDQMDQIDAIAAKSKEVLKPIQEKCLGVALENARVRANAIANGDNKRAGKIINISSVWGMVGASNEVAYSASKAAIIGFTKALAKEVGPSNIHVNAVAPGIIMTDIKKFMKSS